VLLTLGLGTRIVSPTALKDSSKQNKGYKINYFVALE
jgi:hypothetical protein